MSLLVLQINQVINSWDSEGSAEALNPREDWGADDADQVETKEPSTIVPNALLSDTLTRKQTRSVPRGGYFSDEDGSE
jgi:hypothetical protein